MAQKRMFDRAIVETDEFAEMPNSTKALYFLLGMYADDEGFVSLKMVTKIHNFTQDDAGILIAKNYIIPFKTGVVVITDWKENNYLDRNRMKDTRYQEEKKLLVLTSQNRYELNNRLTSVKPEERRGVEKSGEENNKEFSIENKKEEIRRKFITN